MKLNPECASTCLFKGNIPTESGAVHSQQKGKEEKMWLSWTILFTTQTQSWVCTNISIERQLTCWECIRSASKWV